MEVGVKDQELVVKSKSNEERCWGVEIWLMIVRGMRIVVIGMMVADRRYQLIVYCGMDMMILG